MRRLFRSQTSFELLRLFLTRPEQSWCLTELARELNKDAANVLRELSVLEEGAYVDVSDGSRKIYRCKVNQPLFQPLRALFQAVDQADFSKRFQRTWLLAEDIPNMCPFFSKIWLNSFIDAFAEPGGRAYERVVTIYRDYHAWFFFEEKDAHAVADHLVRKMSQDSAFMEETNRNIVRCSDELRAFAEDLPDTQLEGLSNEKLWQIYIQHEQIHTRYYQWGWIPVAADMFGSQLTEYGKRLLRARGVGEERVNEVLALLTQPTRSSLLKIEAEEFSNIAAQVQADPEQNKLFRDLFQKLKEEDVKLFGLYEHTPKYEEHFEKIVRELVERIRPDILAALRDHYAKYFYTKFLFTEEQGVYSFEHYLKGLVRLVNSDPHIVLTLENDRKMVIDQLAKRAEQMKTLGLSKDEMRFFDAWGEFMVTKIYRRFAQIFALYRMVPVLEEIGRRLGLSLKETKFMMTEEIQTGLLEGRVNISDVRTRLPLSVYVTDVEGRAFISGEIAERIVGEIEQPQELLVQEIKGQCGCPGVVQGRVCVVNVIEDMKKMKSGDILVAISTQPDLIPAMKKAAGFVTDQGGVTSHAAIVAREMNKPCVIGTKHASKVLKDGMNVEVDANKGIVKVLAA